MAVTWIQVYTNLKTHRKTYKLADLMSIPNYAAVGILVCLWTWVSANAPDGDITGYTKQALYDAIGWVKTGKSPDLYDKLIESGWIDVTTEKYIIHDWFDYSAKSYEERCKKSNAERQQKYRDKKNSNAEDVTNNVTDNADGNGALRDESRDGNVTDNVTLRYNNAVEDNTIHNITEQYITDPPTSLTGDGGLEETVGRSEKENEILEREAETELPTPAELAEKNAVKEDIRDYYAQKTGTTMPVGIFCEVISCLVKGFEPMLIKEMLCIAVDKGKDRLKYFKAIARNLYGEGVLTYADFCKRGLPHNGNNGNGSFDTDEFFEAALKKSKATSFKSESETA